MIDRRLGYVCLPRSFFDGPIFNGPNPRLRVALTCLQRANYKPGVLADGTAVPRGSFITSRENLARESGVTVQQGRGAISSLAKLNFLTHKTTNHFTMVTVTDYDIWQFSEPSEQPANQPPEQPADNQLVTSEQPADNHNLIRESGKHEIKEPSSSSSEQLACPVERKTRSPHSLSDEEAEALRARWKQAYFGGSPNDGGPKPTVKQVIRVVQALPEGVVEFICYLEDFPSRGLKPRSYEYVFTDLADYWPDRRRDLEGVVAEENARVAAVQAARQERDNAEEKRRALHWACQDKGWKPIYSLACARCAGFGRIPSTEEVCTCAAGVEFTRLSRLCPKCDESGFFTARRGMRESFEWCDCPHAAARRQNEPNLVDESNAHIEKFYSRTTGGRTA